MKWSGRLQDTNIIFYCTSRVSERRWRGRGISEERVGLHTGFPERDKTNKAINRQTRRRSCDLHLGITLIIRVCSGRFWDLMTPQTGFGWKYWLVSDSNVWLRLADLCPWWRLPVYIKNQKQQPEKQKPCRCFLRETKTRICPAAARICGCRSSALLLPLLTFSSRPPSLRSFSALLPPSLCLPRLIFAL